MSTSPDVLATLQPSDYNALDTGVQDYMSIDNSGLAGPSLDNPMGTDPLTGVDLPLPGAQTDPFAPSLTVLPPDASDGLNAYNDGLLPLAPTATVDESLYGSGAFGSGNVGSNSTASGDLTAPGNLPLTPLSSTAKVLLGSAQLATPKANPLPLGASLWQSLFGTASAASKTGGVAGTTAAQKPSTVKQAPPNTVTNPISGTTSALVIGVVAALLGMIIWSFSGAK